MFWGGDGKSIKIFWLQKKVIRLITGVHKCESCRLIFRKYQIFTLASLYIFEMCFLKKHQGNVKQNLEIHGHNTRKKHDLHTRHCSAILYQKSVTNMSIKLFNKLPIQIKQLDNYKSFKREVKTFLICNFFIQLKNFCTMRDVSIALGIFYLFCYWFNEIHLLSGNSRCIQNMFSIKLTVF